MSRCERAVGVLEDEAVACQQRGVSPRDVKKGEGHLRTYEPYSKSDDSAFYSIKNRFLHLFCKKMVAMPSRDWCQNGDEGRVLWGYRGGHGAQTRFFTHKLDHMYLQWSCGRCPTLPKHDATRK